MPVNVGNFLLLLLSQFEDCTNVVTEGGGGDGEGWRRGGGGGEGEGWRRGGGGGEGEGWRRGDGREWCRVGGGSFEVGGGLGEDEGEEDVDEMIRV